MDFGGWGEKGGSAGAARWWSFFTHHLARGAVVVGGSRDDSIQLVLYFLYLVHTFTCTLYLTYEYLVNTECLCTRYRTVSMILRPFD